MRVELLNIGTELLMGFVVNTHASWLGQRLSGLGATLVRQACVNDTPSDIRDALREALLRADVVITTGGLGPTSDDITRTMAVEMLGLETRVDEKTLENLRDRFRRRGIPMSESTKSQAIVPVGATVLPNECGTAPGLAIPLSAPWTCQWLVMLPGPPRELRPMFDAQALPLLRREFAGALPILDCRVFKIVGMGESQVAEKVEASLREIKGLEIGYCARSGEVDLRLLVRGGDADEVHRSADAAEAMARRVLGNSIFGTGDATLEKTVVDLLRARHQTVAVAESCTGGYLAHRITLVSGSSEVFREGWVTYSNDAKTALLGVPGHLVVEYGAVSEPVARAMAEAALHKAGADRALAITGIAGPNGGTPEKPVGTVWIALASKQGTLANHHLFPSDRETFKFVAAQAALNMLRLELLRPPAE